MVVVTAMICDNCGKELQIGEWPFCPHGEARDGGLLAHTFRPYLDEHILPGTQPTEITSPGHRRALMRKEKLDYYSPGVGMPHCEF